MYYPPTLSTSITIPNSAQKWSLKLPAKSFEWKLELGQNLWVLLPNRPQELWVWVMCLDKVVWSATRIPWYQSLHIWKVFGRIIGNRWQPGHWINSIIIVGSMANYYIIFLIYHNFFLCSFFSFGFSLATWPFIIVFRWNLLLYDGFWVISFGSHASVRTMERWQWRSDHTDMDSLQPQ